MSKETVKKESPVKAEAPEIKKEATEEKEPLIQITISLDDKQMVETVIKTRKDKKNVTMQEAVGMIEMGKHDLMAMNQPQQAPAAAPQGQPLELVEIVIDEIDFALDVEGGLDARGVKIGDKVKFPKMAMARRDQMRKDHIEAQKNKAEKK
jgi:hypothetical protein